MKLEDIKVHLANNVLTIKGEKRYQHEERNANFLHSERTYGSFERSFTLGTPIQADAIKARYTDGVLEVQLLKSEQQKLKEIKIEQ
jgi:HSP20 family protein